MEGFAEEGARARPAYGEGAGYLNPAKGERKPAWRTNHQIAGRPWERISGALSLTDRIIMTATIMSNIQSSTGDEAPGNQKAETDPPVPQPMALPLLEMALGSGLELFHGPDASGDTYATVPIGTSQETYRLDDARFSEWLTERHFTATKLCPSLASIKDTIRTLRAKARYEGTSQTVAVRVAEHNGRLYIDLGDASGQAVEVVAGGWQLVRSPVRFLRPSGQLPLPVPERGGSLQEWRNLVNLKDDNAWLLLVTCILCMYRTGLPFVILVVQGQQGSAKSTLCRHIRSLVDPNGTPLCAIPHREQDLVISANHSLLLAFDNLSHVMPWLSDALCRMATGGGHTTRKLFSDTSEIRMNVMRPVLINGITDLTTRSDFLDRTVTVVLPTIPDSHRRCEAEINAEFLKCRPRIFGAMMDALSAALRNLPAIKPATLPRMADFARFGMAAESALGFPEGTFVAAYRQDRLAVHNIALESSPIVPPLWRLAQKGTWVGVSRDLLLAMVACTRLEEQRQSCGWPADPGKLTAQLKRLAPNLRATGLEVQFGHHTNAGITITLRMADWSSPASPALQTPSDKQFNAVTALLGKSPSVTGASPEPEAENARKQGCGDGDDGGAGISMPVAKKSIGEDAA